MLFLFSVYNALEFHNQARSKGNKIDMIFFEVLILARIAETERGYIKPPSNHNFADCSWPKTGGHHQHESIPAFRVQTLCESLPPNTTRCTKNNHASMSLPDKVNLASEDQVTSRHIRPRVVHEALTRNTPSINMRPTALATTMLRQRAPMLRNSATDH